MAGRCDWVRVGRSNARVFPEKRDTRMSWPGQSGAHGKCLAQWLHRGCESRSEGCVERHPQVFRRNRGGKLATGDLSQRVNPGIGAPGALRQGSFTEDATEGGLQLALHRALAGLHLPATEMRAVIRQRELPVPRMRGGLCVVYQEDTSRLQSIRKVLAGIVFELSVVRQGTFESGSKFIFRSQK